MNDHEQEFQDLNEKADELLFKLNDVFNQNRVKVPSRILILMNMIAQYVTDFEDTVDQDVASSLIHEIRAVRNARKNAET